MTMKADGYEFYALIAFERGEADERWARRLWRELERYRIPVGDMPKEARRRDGDIMPPRLRIFRDGPASETHTGAKEDIYDALDASRYLIVICSRRSAGSAYVDACVRRFAEAGRGENIIPFFIEERPDGRGFFHPPSLPRDMKGVSAPEGEEEAFIHLLSGILRVDREILSQAHLLASRRRVARGLFAAACAIVLTAVLGLWAFAAENRAARWRCEAENLVDFLTFDIIRETVAWLPSGKRASISERVREYYERWEPSEPRAAFARAVNLNQLGSGAEHLAGDWDRAVDLVTRALDILKTLHEREPDDESYFAEYSRTLIRAGALFEKEERLERAGIFYKKSLDAARAFSETHPHSLKGMEMVAEGLESLAKLSVRRKKFGDSDAFFIRCEEIWNDMLRRWPEETRSWLWRMKYGVFRSARAYGEIMRNEFADALKYVEEAVTIFEGFYEEDPENLIVRLLYADELGTAAFVAAKLGMPDDGDFFYSAGEELWRGLAEDDPQPGYVYGWAETLTTGGLIRAMQNRGKEAEALLDKAEELVDSLIRMDPDDDLYMVHKSLIGEYRAYARSEKRNGL